MLTREIEMLPARQRQFERLEFECALTAHESTELNKSHDHMGGTVTTVTMSLKADLQTT